MRIEAEGNGKRAGTSKKFVFRVGEDAYGHRPKRVVVQENRM
jgi:hypothetical protein